MQVLRSILQSGFSRVREPSMDLNNVLGDEPQLLSKLEDDSREALKDGGVNNGSLTLVDDEKGGKTGSGENISAESYGCVVITRSPEDHNSINKSGLGPSERNASDTKGKSPILYPQAEEGEEMARLPELGKITSKSETLSPAEIAVLNDKIDELEVAAVDDAELNREGKPTVNKLNKLPILTGVLAKKHLLPEFLGYRILGVLSRWLELLPDGNLTDASVRTEILKILSDLPINLDQHWRRQQFKNSGIGKAVSFLSVADEDATNRKLAKYLSENWSRTISDKTYEDQVSGKMPSGRPFQE